jgi:hypothetical protein
MKRIALGLLLALSLTGAVQHDDGSMTLTKDEQQAILAHVAALVEQIELRDKVIEIERNKVAKPGKCI